MGNRGARLRAARLEAKAAREAAPRAATRGHQGAREPRASRPRPRAAPPGLGPSARPGSSCAPRGTRAEAGALLQPGARSSAEPLGPLITGIGSEHLSAGPQATESLPHRNQIPPAEEGAARSSPGRAGGPWGGCGARGRGAKGMILEPECRSPPGRRPAL